MANKYLTEKRVERLTALCGKYIVIADNSRQEGECLYLQDETLVRPTDTKVSVWTRFLVNAKGFETADEAKAAAAKFRYGHPRIAQV